MEAVAGRHHEAFLALSFFMDDFHEHALDELQQIRDGVLEQRRTLATIAAATGRTEQSLHRIWLLGAVENALWHIERELTKGDERPRHTHCECRTSGCGHLDIRHEGIGGCSFDGCNCSGWT